MSLRRLLSLALAIEALAGCAPDADSVEGRIGEADESIAGGYTDSTDTAVVGIVDFELGTLCTGSLIAPNLVLTARHCVSPVEGTVQGGVVCGQTSFGAIYPAQHFYVTTLAEATDQPSDYHAVREVGGVPPPDSDVCGTDQAVLVLQDLVGPSEAVPLVPRLDAPLASGEPYVAIGYGGTNDDGAGAGTRRRRDGLAVSCVGAACPDPSVMASEWTGPEGICHGDSGGPAIDAQGRVVGITSRGLAGCSNPTYGDPQAYAQWIRDGALYAANLGGYPAPAWAGGTPSEGGGQTAPPSEASMPVGDECGGPSDCPSSRCIEDGSYTYCTRACGEGMPCPDGYVCDVANMGVCLWDRPAHQKSHTRDGDASGCALGAGDSRPSWGALAVALVALAAGARRISRSSRTISSAARRSSPLPGA